MAVTGSCTCGKVQLTIDALPPGTQLCHCIDCRKFTGGTAAYILRVPVSSTTVTGPTKKHALVVPSGAVVSRLWCDECGCNIYEFGSAEPDYYYVHIGLFPQGTAPAPIREIFWDRAESWETPYPSPCRVLGEQTPAKGEEVSCAGP